MEGISFGATPCLILLFGIYADSCMYKEGMHAVSNVGTWMEWEHMVLS